MLDTVKEHEFLMIIYYQGSAVVFFVCVLVNLGFLPPTVISYLDSEIRKFLELQARFRW